MFRDFCTVVLLDTIGNKWGYLCYQTFLMLIRLLPYSTFKYFLLSGSSMSCSSPDDNPSGQMALPPILCQSYQPPIAVRSLETTLHWYDWILSPNLPLSFPPTSTCLKGTGQIFQVAALLIQHMEIPHACIPTPCKLAYIYKTW